MSALESSVTLEDVFAVVEGKRVPLAPELAGYLTLEVADGTDAAGGAVDPRTVYISEEGTVALVRPKTNAATGDAETSVRGILAKLLDASGSATPALTASAKRKPGTGLAALVSELEAALIPVNRAAGRRALARLAREVKRVTLGVGRNASIPAPVKLSAAPSRPAPANTKKDSNPEEVMAGPDAPPGPRPSFSDDAQTLKRGNQVLDLSSYVNSPDAQKPAFVPSAGLTPPPLPGASAQPPAVSINDAVTAGAPPVLPIPAPPAASMASVAPPLRRPGAALPPPPAGRAPLPPPRTGKSTVAPPGAPDRRAEKLFEGDEVDSLLSTFEVSSTAGEKSPAGDRDARQMRNELKAIVGLDPTPGPPDARTLAELTKDVGKDLPKSRSSEGEGEGVDALLALADDQSIPPPPARDDDDRRAESGSPMIPPASVAQPGSPFAAAGPPLPQTPSPLIPLNPAPPPMPSPRLLNDERTPAPPSRPKPVSDASQTGRREKAQDAPRTGRSTTGVVGYREPRAPRTGLAMLVLTLLVLGAGGAAVWMFKPAFFTGKRRPIPSASVTASASAVASAAPKCKVALQVSDVPANAEILLRMGPAPLDVERMPVGTRLEFVGTAEGYVPRRAVIRAEALWEKSADGRQRIDVPIQLDATKLKPGAIDPWPVAEPGSQVGGSGSPGTVHVVSNVRGAEIWLLAGLGPEARIEQLRCDGDIDVLLAGPPQLRKRLHVSEKDIQAATADAQGNRLVSVSGK